MTQEVTFHDVFDGLLDDNEVFGIGDLEARALHPPSHTPDHLGYMIRWDSLFNYEVGSARCDFRIGNARDPFASTRRLLNLPENTKIWT
ncbi:hypothetical protein LZ32DRAFT_659814 [Colletotrichum eremochloae]|nr:hypothetical protein LZ32DRAFT_659814 [Colletotrichum eremochloae]